MKTHFNASPYCIHEDFRDGWLAARAYSRAWQHFNPHDGFIDGQYQPDWDIAQGSPSVSNEELVVPDGSSTTQQLYFETAFTTGVFDFDYYYGSDPSSGFTIIYIVRNSGNNAYRIDLSDSADNFRFQKVDGGSTTSLISTSRAAAQSDTRVRVTRDRKGNWELFEGGTSIGAATDDFLPAPKSNDKYEVRIRHAANADLHIPQISLYHR